MGGALVLASSAAVAFQEQQMGPAPTEAGPSAAPAETGSAAVSPSDVQMPSAPAGTEIRIPGLGKLGVIPKMDFGLELLYGASDVGKRKIDEGTEKDEPQVMIRGSIKHRF